MTLAEFLRARLDEDEQVALAVEDNSAPWRGQWKAESSQVLRTYNDWVLVYPHQDAPLRPGLIAHLARHDPARVLREVDATRRIIALHDVDGGHECPTFDKFAPGEKYTAYETVCTTLRLLALQYADHPDYRDEWAA